MPLLKSFIFISTTLFSVVLTLAGTQSNLNINNRQAILYVPDGTTTPPVVISMHGIGIPAGYNQGMMQFERLADTAKFIVVYPEAEGLRWDLGSNKDVDFILAIIDHLHSQYNADRNRVYASGFSMGGMMSWYLSCKIPDKIAAIVPGNGYPMGGLSGCSEVRHVPALQIHGDADDFVSYANFVNTFLPAQRTRYGCPASPTRTSPYPTEENGRNSSQIAQPSRSYLEVWEPCTRDGLQSQLALLTVHGMIHDWATPNKENGSDDPAYRGKPFDVNGTWEAWNWMKNHSLQGELPVVRVPSPRDSVFNGNFDLGSLGWVLNVWGGTAQGAVSSGEYQIQVNTTGENPHSIQLIQNGIILERGKSYEIQFDAYSSVNRTLDLNVEMDVSPWTSYLAAVQSIPLTTTQVTHSHAFTMNNPTDSNSRIAFNVGVATGTVNLDNISIHEISAPVPISSRAILPVISSTIENGAWLRVQYARVGEKNDVSLTLHDFSGKQIIASAPQKGTQGNLFWTTDMSAFPAGIYLLRISASGQTVYHRQVLNAR